MSQEYSIHFKTLFADVTIVRETNVKKIINSELKEFLKKNKIKLVNTYNDQSFNQFTVKLEKMVEGLLLDSEKTKKYHVVIIDDVSANAFFSELNAKENIIGINLGLLDMVSNDDELAFVLGHELSHGKSDIQEYINSKSGSSAQDVTNGLLLKRISENEADIKSIFERMFPQRYNLYAAIRMMEKLGKVSNGYSLSHTQTESRADILSIVITYMRRKQGKETKKDRPEDFSCQILKEIKDGFMKPENYKKYLYTQINRDIGALKRSKPFDFSSINKLSDKGEMQESELVRQLNTYEEEFSKIKLNILNKTNELFTDNEKIKILNDIHMVLVKKYIEELESTTHTLSKPISFNQLKAILIILKMPTYFFELDLKNEYVYYSRESQWELDVIDENIERLKEYQEQLKERIKAEKDLEILSKIKNKISKVEEKIKKYEDKKKFIDSQRIILKQEIATFIEHSNSILIKNYKLLMDNAYGAEDIGMNEFFEMLTQEQREKNIKSILEVVQNELQDNINSQEEYYKKYPEVRGVGTIGAYVPADYRATFYEYSKVLKIAIRLEPERAIKVFSMFEPYNDPEKYIDWMVAGKLDEIPKFKAIAQAKIKSSIRDVFASGLEYVIKEANEEDYGCKYSWLKKNQYDNLIKLEERINKYFPDTDLNQDFQSELSKFNLNLFKNVVSTLPESVKQKLTSLRDLNLFIGFFLKSQNINTLISKEDPLEILEFIFRIIKDPNVRADLNTIIDSVTLGDGFNFYIVLETLSGNQSLDKPSKIKLFEVLSVFSKYLSFDREFKKTGEGYFSHSESAPIDPENKITVEFLEWIKTNHPELEDCIFDKLIKKHENFSMTRSGPYTNPETEFFGELEDFLARLSWKRVDPIDKDTPWINQSLLERKEQDYISDYFNNLRKQHAHLDFPEQIKKVLFLFHKRFGYLPQVMKWFDEISPEEKIIFLNTIMSIKKLNQENVYFSFDIARLGVSLFKSFIESKDISKVRIERVLETFLDFTQNLILANGNFNKTPELDTVFEYLWDKTENLPELRDKMVGASVFNNLWFDNNVLKLTKWHLDQLFQISLKKYQIPSSQGEIREIIRNTLKHLDTLIPEPCYVKDQLIEWVSQSLLTNQAETQLLFSKSTVGEEWFKTKGIKLLDTPYLLNFSNNKTLKLELIKFLSKLIDEDEAALKAKEEMGKFFDDQDVRDGLRVTIKTFNESSRNLQAYLLMPLLNEKNGILSDPITKEKLYDLILGDYKAEPVARFLFQSYLSNLAESEQKVVLSHILTSIKNNPQKKPSFGQILESMGPLGIKIGQLLKASGLLPDALSKELDHFFSKADPLTRNEIFNQLETIFGKTIRPIDFLGIYAGGGSINYVVGAELLDPNTKQIKKVAIRLLRPNTEGRIKNEAEILKNVISDLCNSKDEKLKQAGAVLSEALDGALKNITHGGAELDLTRDAFIYEKAQSAYEGRTQSNAGKSGYKISVVRPLAEFNRLIPPSFVKNVAFFEWVEGVHLEEIKDQELKSALAHDIVGAELDALLQRGVYDPDGHPGNWMIDSATKRLVRIDYSQLTEIPKENAEACKVFLTHLLNPNIQPSQYRDLAKHFENFFDFNFEKPVDLEFVISAIMTQPEFPNWENPMERVFFLRRALEEHYQRSLGKSDLLIRMKEHSRSFMTALSKLNIYSEYFGTTLEEGRGNLFLLLLEKLNYPRELVLRTLFSKEGLSLAGLKVKNFFDSLLDKTSKIKNESESMDHTTDPKEETIEYAFNTAHEIFAIIEHDKILSILKNKKAMLPFIERLRAGLIDGLKVIIDSDSVDEADIHALLNFSLKNREPVQILFEINNLDAVDSLSNVLESANTTGIRPVRIKISQNLKPIQIVSLKKLHEKYHFIFEVDPEKVNTSSIRGLTKIEGALVILKGEPETPLPADLKDELDLHKKLFQNEMELRLTRERFSRALCP